LLIKSHYDYSCTILEDCRCLSKEVFLTFLQGDTVYDALALSVLKTSFDDLKLGRIDHHRHICNVRVALEESHELCHCHFAVYHSIIKVDIEDLCSILDLVLGNCHGLLIFSLLDEFLELDAPRYVAPLANIHESDDVREEEFC